MISTIDGIFEAARQNRRGIIAVAAAHDDAVIEAVVAARKAELITPLLVGHVDEIIELLVQAGEDPAEYEIIAAEEDADSAAKAVALCAEGKADFLMKGIVSTADIMRAVFKKDGGLRSGRLTSHFMLYELPTYHKLLLVTDAGLNMFPIWRKKPTFWKMPPPFCRHWATSISTPLVSVRPRQSIPRHLPRWMLLL